MLSACKERRSEAYIRSTGVASESEDELFTIEQVGTVKHDWKGQFFVPLCSIHELGRTLNP